MTSDNGGPPDFVIILFASIPSTLGLQGTLQAAGFKGPIENTQTYDPQLAAPSKGGSVYIQFGAFETADTVPGVKQMAADLKKANVTERCARRPSATCRRTCSSRRSRRPGKNLTVESFQKANSNLKYNLANTAGPHDLPEGPGTAGCLRNAGHVERHGIRRDGPVLLR